MVAFLHNVYRVQCVLLQDLWLVEQYKHSNNNFNTSHNNMSTVKVLFPVRQVIMDVIRSLRRNKDRVHVSLETGL